MNARSLLVGLGFAVAFVLGAFLDRIWFPRPAQYLQQPHRVTATVTDQYGVQWQFHYDYSYGTGESPSDELRELIRHVKGETQAGEI